MFTFTHASFPAKYSESTQQIKMAKMAVAKDSDRGLTWTHDETRCDGQFFPQSVFSPGKEWAGPFFPRGKN